MKKEIQGLLSTKVINLRKDVDKQRHQLRELQERRDILTRQRQELEQDLKNIESVERRRTDVSLETEKSLTEAKYEISQMKKEIHFLNTNRSDLEVAIGSINEEKRMLERELLSIRSQLQLRANGNTMRLGSTLTGQ
jgi:chromosome segregation ATPase